MAKVYLKFNAAVIKEIELKKEETTFGRKPGNDIVIDNPAISGFHGKIVKEGDQYYVEDLNSTNGTYLNGQRIKKSALKNKDQISMARHGLEFSTDILSPQAVPDPSLPAPSAPAPSIITPTMPAPNAPAPNPVLNSEPPKASSPTEKKPQLDMLRESLGLSAKETAPAPAPAPATSATPSAPRSAPSAESVFAEMAHPAPPPTPQIQGVIKIIAGSVNGQTEVKLKEMVTYIGTADQAAIKIRGLMAPSLAAAISRRPDGYFLKAVKPGYPKVNSMPITEQILLENGALIEAGGTNMVFYLADAKKSSE